MEELEPKWPAIVRWSDGKLGLISSVAAWFGDPDLSAFDDPGALLVDRRGFVFDLSFFDQAVEEVDFGRGPTQSIRPMSEGRVIDRDRLVRFVVESPNVSGQRRDAYLREIEGLYGERLIARTMRFLSDRETPA